MASRLTILAIAVTLVFSCASPLLAAGSPSFVSELNVKERYEYYEIRGKTLDELRLQMRSNGTKWNDGKVYSGVTSWDIKYFYDIGDDACGYGVKSAKTTVEIVYRLPRLAAEVSDPELEAAWNAYMERLQHHEFGHKELAVRTASAINEIFATLPSFGSVDLLSQEISKRTEEKFRQLKETQVLYDDETRHGETQGAILPSELPKRYAGA